MSFDPTTRTALSPAELALTVNDTEVTRHHHAQKQLNLDIVNYVVQYGPCGFIELYDLFGDRNTGDGKKSMERLRARLGHLTYSNQLVSTGTAGARRWHAPLQDSTPEQGCGQDRPKTLPVWVGTITPPARNDCMHGPTYVPERASPLRPGSQDFKRCASHGDRC